MSLREIASAAGVSVSTVSRIVNGKERHRISDDTRRRVLDIARTMRYQPNQQAVALATGRLPNTIGLHIPYYSHTFRSFYYSEISCGAADAAAKAGIDVTLLVSHDVSGDSCERLIASHRVGGLMLLGSHPDDASLEVFRASGLPCVAVNNDTVAAGVSTVMSENEAGAAAATRHLVARGHRRIAFIAGPERLPDAVARRSGYVRALGEAGIEVDRRLIASGEFTERGGRQAMRELLSRGVPFTAVVGANDQSTISAMQVARRSGVNVPDDIAFVGFDDIPLASHVDPALSTVHQPIYRMGYRAAELLLEQMAGGLREPERVRLRTRLVVRESCGSRRAAGRAEAGPPADPPAGPLPATASEA
jgi:LacI family transcriptional regulator